MLTYKLDVQHRVSGLMQATVLVIVTHRIYCMCTDLVHSTSCKFCTSIDLDNIVIPGRVCGRTAIHSGQLSAALL